MIDANAKPEFEVATIKPSRPDERFTLLVNRSGMLNTTSTSLADLLKFAYDLHPARSLADHHGSNQISLMYRVSRIRRECRPLTK